jgi:porin
LLRPSPDAYGATFSANHTIGESLMWFLRAGIGTGSMFATGALSGGVGWRPPGAPRNLLGVGAGWTNPEQNLPLPIPIMPLRSQATGEIFYRVALLPNFAITPDYQLLYHPTLDPRRNTLSVFSFRGRLTL